MKTCTSCGKEKPLSEYYVYPKIKKLMNCCKKCKHAKNMARSAANREKIKSQHRNLEVDQNREWKAAIEKINEKQREWITTRREEINLSNWYFRNLLLSRSTLTLKEVPKELIECKRLQVMIKRELKKEMTK